MLTVNRHRGIRRYIETHGSARIGDLAQLLGVSSSTIRRDLDDLTAAGEIGRVRGGAVPLQDGEAAERVASERALAFADEKHRIAAAAARLTRPGDTVFISGGTTTGLLTPLIAATRPLAVVTNAVNVAYHLAQQGEVETIVLGGYLRHSEMTLLGAMAEQAVLQFRIDVAFYGCYGLDPDDGISGASLQEAAMDRQVIAAADRLVLLADRSKLTQRGPVRLAGIDRITTLVTDDGAPADALARIEAAGVTVIRA